MIEVVRVRANASSQARAAVAVDVKGHCTDAVVVTSMDDIQTY